MSIPFKNLATIALVASLVAIAGCVVTPDSNNPYSYSDPNQAEWIRGCDDAKRNHYDRASHTQAYKEGHKSCKATSGAANSPHSGGADWDRGCADAKSGSYDRSGNASQAYENGWNACH